MRQEPKQEKTVFESELTQSGRREADGENPAVCKASHHLFFSSGGAEELVRVTAAHCASDCLCQQPSDRQPVSPVPATAVH